MELNYFDISWFSKVDGPGRRVVLYLQGCSLSCPWCHSPHSQAKEAPILFNDKRCIGCGCCVNECKKGVHEIKAGIHILKRINCIKCGACVDACPTSKRDYNSGALILPTKKAEVKEIFDLLLPQLEVLKDIGGITISGGEALLQKEAVLELLQLCKANEIHTAVETSLALPVESYKYVSDYVDCWLIGIRDISFENKGERNNELMTENVSFVSGLNKEVIVRIPLIKGYTDALEQKERLLGFLKRGGFKDIEILPCNKNMEHYYVLSGTNPKVKSKDVIPKEEEVNNYADFFYAYGFNVRIVE